MEKLAYIIPLASCLYIIVSTWWVRAFFSAEGRPHHRRDELPYGGPPREGPLRERPPREDSPDEAPRGFAPAASILKPVKGLDRRAYDNYASYCHQAYPEYEVLFAVADVNDPAVAVIERLQRDFPSVRIRLLAGVPQIAANPKVSSLAALSREAEHELLVVSDSDMRVTPDYLRRVVAPLERESIGLVTCCYRGVAPITFTAKLEALHMGVTFLPQVVVARRFLDMQFALGATMAFRRSDLLRSGGWARPGAYLAEDNQLALQTHEIGKRVVLSDYVVEAFLGPTTWREQWDREVRWARTNRSNRPREYVGILFTLNVPLALLLLPIDGAGIVGWSIVGAALVVRWLSAWLIAGFSGNQALQRWLPWLPVRDLLSALIWCAGLTGRRVVWRGDVYRLRRDGRMDELSRYERGGPAAEVSSPPWDRFQRCFASHGKRCDRSSPTEASRRERIL